MRRIYVIGPDGAAVRGLTKDAFDLRVNGRRQAIDSFDVVAKAVALRTASAGFARVDFTVEQR